MQEENSTFPFLFVLNKSLVYRVIGSKNIEVHAVIYVIKIHLLINFKHLRI